MPFAEAGPATPEPTGRSMANYKSDMLEFGYDATLHVHHPTMAMDRVGPSLGLVPKESMLRGTRKLQRLGTNYREIIPNIIVLSISQQSINTILLIFFAD